MYAPQGVTRDGNGMRKSKDEWRAEWSGSLPNCASGKLAEAVRRLDAYHQCHQLFVAPAPVLAQIRVNALLDGKELIVPGPGLRDGFYLLRPFRIAFPDLSFAVSLRGIPSHGQLLAQHELAQLFVEVLITEALAVDSLGNRLGDGLGFFDLTCALLHQLGALSASPTILAAGVPYRAEQLPVDPWDVRMSGLVTAQGAEFFPPMEHLPKIDWQQLPRQRIKKISPLWKEWLKTQSVDEGFTEVDNPELPPLPD